MLSQKGIAHLALIVLGLLGIGLGIYLVQTKTNLFPSAQIATSPARETAFRLTTTYPAYPLEPPRQYFYPGEKVSVDVIVSSDVDAANTFSAIVNFSPDLLEVLSIRKEDWGGSSIMHGDSAEDLLPDKQTTSTSEAVLRIGSATMTKSFGGRVVGPGCKVGGCSGQLCEGVNEAGFTTCDVPPELVCYQSARCEKQKSGQCGWTQSAELAQCLKNPGGEKKCAQVITRACYQKSANCTSEACTGVYYPKECKDFPTPCDVPEGWIIERTPDPTLPPTCPMAEQMCTDGTISTYVGDNNGCPLYKCLPVPSCKPIPSCVYSNPSCDIYIDPNDPSWCHSQPSVRDYFIQHWLPETNFDNQSGRVVLSGGVTGAGIKTTSSNRPIMATIIFVAKKAGEVKLDYGNDSLILRNSDSTNILSRQDGLSVQIKERVRPVTRGDLDGDGVVGVIDFSILLSNWGSDSPKADINGDGKVNIYDFSIMLSNWSSRSGGLLRKCPEEWHQNQMPGTVEDNNSTSREYFIYDGKRKETSEFDVSWVKANCGLEPQISY